MFGEINTDREAGVGCDWLRFGNFGEVRKA